MNKKLTIEFSCSNCSFSANVTFDIGKDGTYTIPTKFCPDCLVQLKRDIIKHEPIEDKTRTPNPIPEPARILERPQNGDSDPKKS